MDAAPVIRARGLAKSYGANAAVRGVDIDVFAGEIFGLIGPDGAGKTTCFNMLAGILQPSAGELTVLGRPAAEGRTSIGYLTQQFSLYEDLSVDENLEYAAGMRLVPTQAFRERRARYLKIMDLEPFGARIAGALSGGMKQKLALCCALIAEPRVLLLDEPTTGVDPISRREFWRVVARLAETGVAIVIATPYLDEAERCRSVALMYDGTFHRVGKPRELRAAEGLRRLEIRVDDLRRADAALTALANAHAGTIVDVQPFGDRIDVLARDRALAVANVRERLAREHIAITGLTDEDPTLENVFVLDLHANLATAERAVPFPESANGAAHARNGTTLEARARVGTAIEARALSKRFGAFTAVDRVSLRVAYGEIYGLLGANGAGKTTTIKMLCGLIAADEGLVTIAGVAHDLRSPELRRRIGYMSQKFTLYDDLTIGENLEFYAGIYGIPRAERAAKIDWVLESCDLAGRRNDLTAKLPGGYKQRAAFGASVMHDPEILFLDEPTSGVDPLARRAFWRLIDTFAARGAAIVVTTHHLDEAEHCNRMGLMAAGKTIAEGSSAEIKALEPASVFEVQSAAPERALEAIEGILPAWRASLFGDRVHVVLDDPESEVAALRAALAAAGIDATFAPTPQTLEDAFIGLVQRQAA
jgi:ABC-2 type transport system ATP-binding protein